MRSSVLSPWVKLAELLARVAWVGEKQTSSPATVPTSDRAVVGDVHADIEARIKEARRSPLERLYDAHMATKRTEPQVLVRRGVGQVLGVR